MKDAAALLDLVIARAPKLRAAGVLELGIEGLTMELAPAAPAEADADAPAPEQEQEPTSMWNDPELYGLPRGSDKVPGNRSRRGDKP